MGSRPPYRSTLDQRPAAPPALRGPDELDRTARQVRLDYEGAAVHRLKKRLAVTASGVAYATWCGESLSSIEGAILTTREVDCWECQGRKRNRGGRG